MSKTYKAYSRKNILAHYYFKNLPPDLIRAVMAVSTVLPFRVNNYVMEELIDWDNIPDDPIFQLTFPQSDMLEKQELDRMQHLLDNDASPQEIQIAARQIQMGLNPHPAGQMDMNVPVENGKAFKGMQHKYRETALFFPSHGQTCHAYCTYCFRWPQFVGLDKLKFASRETDTLVDYLRGHPEITDVLFTGGDPLDHEHKNPAPLYRTFA